MSEKQIPHTPPVSAADCYDVDGVPGWTSRVRSAIVRDGQAIRAGANLTIEAKTLTPDVARELKMNEWGPIMTPTSGTTFVSAQDRDLILKMLQGELPIPNIRTDEKSTAP